jgi:FAD synthetase
MKRVLIFGTFDVIHPGHINFLKQARAVGDYIIASIARDDFVSKKKGRKPIHDELERLNHIRESGLVDEAYLSDAIPGTYSLVRRLKPDVVCFGHDQRELEENFRFWQRVQKLSIPTVTLKAYRPEKYKSSRLNQVDSV